MEVLGSSSESQGWDWGLGLYLHECTEYRMYHMAEWQTKQVKSAVLNVKVEPFDVLGVEMSWCRPSVVRLARVMAFKALKAQNKLISFLILSLDQAVVFFFPQLWGLHHLWNLHMTECSGLECPRYDEIEKAVIRAGNILVIAGFLSDKVIEEEWNLFYLRVSLYLQKKGCLSEQAEVNILYNFISSHVE